MKLKLAILALAATVTVSNAASKWWDASGPAGNGVGGSATWGTTFSTNAAGTALTTAANSDDIIFAGTAGTITLSGDKTAASLTFNTTNYKITGNSATTRTLTGPISLASNVNLIIGNGETTDIAIDVGSVSGTTGSTLTINGAATGTNHTRLNLASASANISVPVTVTGTGFASIVGTASGTQITGTVTGSGSRLNLGATSGDALTITQKIDNGTGTVRIAAGSSGGAGVLTLSGSGNTWGATELNNDNSGILRMGVLNALPTATTLTFGTTSGNGDSIVELRGFNTTIGQLTNGAEAGGFLRNTSGTAATLTVSGSDTSAAAFSGAIQNGTGAGALAFVRSGSGTTTLSATNSFTGGTTISGGKLVLGHATDTLANSGSVLVSGGILDLGANSDTVGAVTLSSGSITGTGTLTGTSYSLTDSGTVSAKLGGAVALSKSGAGTATLSGANTYSGTTDVQAGKLVVTNTIGSSAVTVSGSGAILATDTAATIGSTLAINNGAILAVGDAANATTATATVTGATTFNNGSIFSWDINAAGTSHDKLISSSLVDGGAAGGAVFRIVAADATFANTFWDTDRTWTDIFTTNGSAAIANWATIFGSTVSVVNSGFTSITPVGGSFSVSGSTLTWTAVPEPTSALAGLLLGAGLLRRRRNR